jgi:hypothetical protein
MTVEQVDKLWKRAMKYEWTDAEHASLVEFKEGVLGKIETQRQADVAKDAAELMASSSAA